ncbi:MAG: hypothetical protein ACRC2T_15475, partial [Thermoguttaceae bacterium]
MKTTAKITLLSLLIAAIPIIAWSQFDEPTPVEKDSKPQVVEKKEAKPESTDKDVPSYSTVVIKTTPQEKPAAAEKGNYSSMGGMMYAPPADSGMMGVGYPAMGQMSTGSISVTATPAMPMQPRSAGMPVTVQAHAYPAPQTFPAPPCMPTMPAPP